MWGTTRQLSQTAALHYFHNNLPFILDEANIVMYADDSTIYTLAQTNDELEIINTEPRGVTTWVKENKLVLITSKTNYMIVG